MGGGGGEDIDLSEIKDAVEEVLFFIKGGPDPRAKKLRRTSYVFLSMPDPTSVSTMIGITMYTTSKVLEKRRVKGLEDYLREYNVRVRELCSTVKKLRELFIIP